MENYKKGENVEEPLERTNIPIENLPTKFLWMQVKGGSKIRNLLTHALNTFCTEEVVVWTGCGSAVGKTITCAEIMKRECDNKLHQLTKICYRQVEEYWDPLLPELDQLVVKRKLPMIHIVLSRDKINNDELGYQAPGMSMEDVSLTKHTPQGSKQNNSQKNKSRNQKVATTSIKVEV